MQDSKLSCLIFVHVEKQRFGEANFSGRGMILIGQFFAVGSPGRGTQIPPDICSSLLGIWSVLLYKCMIIASKGDTLKHSSFPTNHLLFV